MSKKRKPKPTNNDFVIVINSLIQDIHSLKNDMDVIMWAFDMYIEYKSDAKPFNEYMNDKLKVNNEIQATEQDNPVADKASIKDKGWWAERICKNRR